MLVDRQCLRKHILLVLIARTISSAQRIDNALQAFFRLLSYGIELLIPDNTQHRLRIGYLDAATISDGAYHDIARQEQPYLWFLFQRTVGQDRVASSQDKVWLHLSTKLLTQRLTYIDLGQHPEALSLEGVPDTRNSLLVGYCNVVPKPYELLTINSSRSLSSLTFTSR